MSELFPKSLKLPSNLIPILQKPIGKFFKVSSGLDSPEKRVIDEIKDRKEFVFVVGDFVSNSLLSENFVPDLINRAYKSMMKFSGL